jgi:hypothetical protein
LYHFNILVRRVWRYLRGNQNPYIKEGQRTQWPKKGQKAIYKTLHIQLKIEYHEPYQKPEVNSGSPERWSDPVPLVTSVMLLNLVTNPVISHEWGRTESRKPYICRLTGIWTWHILSTFFWLTIWQHRGKLVSERLIKQIIIN